MVAPEKQNVACARALEEYRVPVLLVRKKGFGVE
jgi:hypothetical protein